MENETIRILLERQKEQILADFRAKIQKHEFQADSDRRSIQELNGIFESQRREIDHTIASDEQLRRDQLLLQEQLSEQNRDLREARMSSWDKGQDLMNFRQDDWMELLSLSEGKLIILLQVMNNSDEINCFFKNNYQNKIGIFVKLVSNVFMR